MKSTQRPSKPPKHQPEPNYQSPNPKPELVAYRPVEQHQASSQPDSSKSDQPPQVEPEHQVIANDKPLPLEKDKAERVYAPPRKSNSPQ
uniref:hypothetical protein n=1 Tax=Nostoc sp. MG11 TaxID=2721166 RepID=UPI001D008F0B